MDGLYNREKDTGVWVCFSVLPFFLLPVLLFILLYEP